MPASSDAVKLLDAPADVKDNAQACVCGISDELVAYARTLRFLRAVEALENGSVNEPLSYTE